jgi:membrane protein involved in colicin uptake
VVGEGGCVESAKVKASKKKQQQKREAAKKASKTRVERAAKSQATRIQRAKNKAAAEKRKAILAAIRAKQASNRRNAAAERRGTFVINNRKSNSNSNNNNKNNSNSNNNNNANKPPNMESFKLYLNAGNVTNETVKNLLNRITFNKSKYNGPNKQTFRNVLNKVIRLSKSDNLNRKARNLKNTMFANNRRQLRTRS